MTAADLTAIGPALILAGAALIATILPIPRRTGARPLAWGRAASLDDGAVRHLTLGATGTATALYGIALLYAASGETGYAGVGRATHNPLYLAGLGLALAGLASHVVIARGHRWAILIDIAIVGAVLRLVVATAAGEAALDWQVSLASLAAVAFVAPVLAAIGERRVRRLVGYATASQLGYVAAA